VVDCTILRGPADASLVLVCTDDTFAWFQPDNLTNLTTVTPKKNLKDIVCMPLRM